MFEQPNTLPLWSAIDTFWRRNERNWWLPVIACWHLPIFMMKLRSSEQKALKVSIATRRRLSDLDSSAYFFLFCPVFSWDNGTPVRLLGLKGWIIVCSLQLVIYVWWHWLQYAVKDVLGLCCSWAQGSVCINMTSTVVIGVELTEQSIETEANSYILVVWSTMCKPREETGRGCPFTHRPTCREKTGRCVTKPQFLSGCCQ